MSEELKPCECCSSNDWLFSNPVSFKGSVPITWVVVCKKCGTNVEGRSQIKTEAIWNTRPIEDALRLEIKRLESELATANARYEKIYTYLNDVLEECSDE